MLSILSSFHIDGTTRRITNWDTLTKQEKDSSWRLISARNRKRIEVLQKKSFGTDASAHDESYVNNDLDIIVAKADVIDTETL